MLHLVVDHVEVSDLVVCDAAEVPHRHLFVAASDLVGLVPQEEEGCCDFKELQLSVGSSFTRVCCGPLSVEDKCDGRDDECISKSTIEDPFSPFVLCEVFL